MDWDRQASRCLHIATFSPDRWIVTVGSWSKVVWAGLRIGWIRASEPTISRLARLKAYADNGTPVLSQLVAAQIIQRFDAVAAVRRSQIATKMRRPHRRSHENATELDVETPGRRSFALDPVAGRIRLWLSQVALRHSVEFSPGPVFCPDEGHQNYLRLPFVGSPEMIEEA